ncbi:MAG: DsbA family oxidoreductase [Labilithrix sp.]|nr:DsbA family oxidoreductase [Labilithrix sp.]
MKVDVWYDLVCPWCWLGKARLDAATAGRADVEVVTHGFQLDAKAPRDRDVPMTELLVTKLGMSRVQIAALHERLVTMGREVGIEYQFDRVRSSNTSDAHQLVHHARAAGGNAKANEVVERMFRANFRDGLRIGSRDVLVRLAKEAGLDEADAAAALEEQRYAEAVRDDEQRVRGMGVSGVPFFLVDGEVRISGAESIDALRAALAR